MVGVRFDNQLCKIIILLQLVGECGPYGLCTLLNVVSFKLNRLIVIFYLKWKICRPRVTMDQVLFVKLLSRVVLFCFRQDMLLSKCPLYGHAQICICYECSLFAAGTMLIKLVLC